MVQNVASYKHQSYFQRKYKHNYLALLNDSMIYDMTLDEYSAYIETDLQPDAIEMVYDSPKVTVKDNKILVLKKRIHTFFEEDIDINRDKNINKASHRSAWSSNTL